MKLKITKIKHPITNTTIVNLMEKICSILIITIEIALNKDNIQEIVEIIPINKVINH